MLMKVVESVNNVKKGKSNKSKVKCREFKKPSGCAWGEQCRFEHIEDQRLEKKTDCSYCMDGYCRFSEKECWNLHNPAKKGNKTKKSSEGSNPVFQEGQEVQEVPPGQESPSRRTSVEDWESQKSRKARRRIKATTAREKENGNQEVNSAHTKEGETSQTFPLDGGEEQATPPFLIETYPKGRQICPSKIR